MFIIKSWQGMAKLVLDCILYDDDDDHIDAGISLESAKIKII